MLLLAMDHRDSLVHDVYGIAGVPTPAQATLIAAGKRVVFAGLVSALERGADRGEAGVLVDERYGEKVARSVRDAGLTLAMPIERSGRAFFSLEYGHSWLRHVETFAPDYVKVLVRDNPDLDPTHRASQCENLAAVSAALRSAGRRLLFELLVPPTEAQRSPTYDARLRPALTVQVIGDLQQAGVEPDIWKIEGLESHADAAAIVAIAQQGGRTGVRCVVLGRDAPPDRLDHWLHVAAGTKGFVGFAIGRSIWEKPLSRYVAGDADEPTTVARIAENYLHFAAAYR